MIGEGLEKEKNKISKEWKRENNGKETGCGNKGKRGGGKRERKKRESEKGWKI